MTAGPAIQPEASKKPGPRATRTFQPLAYRPKDAAALLGISRSTVYEMIAAGKLEARKLGGSTIIRADELARILDQASLTPAAKAAQAPIK